MGGAPPHVHKTENEAGEERRGEGRGDVGLDWTWFWSSQGKHGAQGFLHAGET